MTVLAIIATTAAAFLFGFLLGAFGLKRDNRIEKSYATDSEEIEKLRREYSNILSYDGTKQSQR